MTTDNKDDDIDLVGDSQCVNESALGQVGTLVDELNDKYREAEALELKFKKLHAEILELETKTLPEAMRTANTKEFTTLSGEKVGLIEFIQVSIPSQTAIDKARGEEKEELIRRRINAHNYLRDNGHGGLLKTDVIVSFGKDKEEEVAAAIKLLKEHDLQPTVEEGVHAATLASWAKEQKDVGKIPPEDFFKTFVGTKAVLFKPRKTGKRK